MSTAGDKSGIVSEYIGLNFVVIALTVVFLIFLVKFLVKKLAQAKMARQPSDDLRGEPPRGGYKMKYKRIIFISLLLSLIGLMCLFIFTKKEILPVLTWDRTYGGSYFDRAESLIQTADGGYAADGITSSKGAEDFNLSELKRYEEAIEAYEKAIEINPQYTDAWYNKGFCLSELKRYEEAIEA